MPRRLFNVGKVGLFLDSYRGGTEKRSSGEVKTVVLQLRMQPFDAKWATAIDEGIGEDSNVRAMLFDMNHADPKAHVERVNFTLGCPRQNIHIFASPDTEECRIALLQVKVSGTFAKTAKSEDEGFSWCFTVTVGPVGRDELELIHDWMETQRFCTFEESEPLLDMEDDGAEEGTDADIKSRRPAPVWGDDAPTPQSPEAPDNPLTEVIKPGAGGKAKGEPVRQRTISHAEGRKKRAKKAAGVDAKA